MLVVNSDLQGPTFVFIETNFIYSSKWFQFFFSFFFSPSQKNELLKLMAVESNQSSLVKYRINGCVMQKKNIYIYSQFTLIYPG